jgi:AraC family transcriptional regulator, positive regulator of tynA and feaB
MAAQRARHSNKPRITEIEGPLWQSSMSSEFVEMEYEQLEPTNKPVGARIIEYPFGDLVFARSVTSDHAHRVTRSERLIRESTHDNFFIGLLLNGTFVLGQEGHTVNLRPGDIAILDSTRVYRIHVPRNLDVLWIRTPRYRLEGRLPYLSAVMANRIDGQTGCGHVASEVLRAALSEAERLSPREASRITNNIFDLIALSLSGTQPDGRKARTTRTATTLASLKHYIEARLDDDMLTTVGVAKANRLSIRYINKLFSKEGISLARWIRIRRLERCRQDLENPALRKKRVGDIAIAHGFKNITHFNRQFKARFGCTPRAIRNQD